VSVLSPTPTENNILKRKFTADSDNQLLISREFSRQITPCIKFATSPSQHWK